MTSPDLTHALMQMKKSEGGVSLALRDCNKKNYLWVGYHTAKYNLKGLNGQLQSPLSINKLDQSMI